MKIIDFSTAQRQKGSRVFGSAGTPAFQSPENIVLSPSGLDGRAADIWSLGVSLFTYVNVRLPFDATSNEGEAATPEQVIAKKILYNNIVFEDSNSAEMRDLVAKCCEKDPTKRPNVRQFLAHPWFAPLKID